VNESEPGRKAVTDGWQEGGMATYYLVHPFNSTVTTRPLSLLTLMLTLAQPNPGSPLSQVRNGVEYRSQYVTSV
jgi:hypothetical protein